MKNNKIMEKFFEALGILVVVLFIGSVITALPVMWLWNWLVPVLFGLVKIGFWQALGLSALCGLLFKSYNVNKNG